MQPKSFINRMSQKKNALENEAGSQANQATDAAPLSLSSMLSSIASRMSVRALCGTEDPMTSMSAIASQMRLGLVNVGSTRHDTCKTPEPVAVCEPPESPLTSAAPSTPTLKSESVSSRDGEEAPRSLKRKRQPAKILATPTSSTRTTPAHSPNEMVTTPGSSYVSRRISTLKLGSPVAEQSPCRPRLRSEARKLKKEVEKTNASPRSSQADVSSLRTQLDREKRDNDKIKVHTTSDKDELKAVRAELNALQSELESQRCERSALEEEVAAMRAELNVFRSEVQGDSTNDATITPETRTDVDRIILMNDMLRRVIHGERIHNREMTSKLNSVREKVGPLLAKVDNLADIVNEMRAHLSAHDAPIELTMDFVRNFHQWWVNRYNARRGDGGSAENDLPQAEGV
ncbi:hypothetical protein PMG11_09664 [Penicillium brasilianum]|uniref:Uncharacterized protein n=1 Tax=Penicillium brasilianum TaxID=104259 RepID=A0A0F7U1G5_PENBI|nr:hypothetical protein PMG11_09664 [Penicillium brasilianum]